MKPALLALLALVTTLAACGDDDAGEPVTPDAGTPTGALYVLATAVSDAEGANTYVRTFGSLAPQSEELDLGAAAEFPGWSDLKVLDGKVFVSSGEAPVVTRFRVDAAGQLVEDGQISFAAYAEYADMYSQIFISPSKAYLTNGNKEYVVWNPSTLTITGTIPLPVLAQREGIDGNFGMDRGTALRGNLLFHTANWFDYEGYKMLDSRVAIFDVETDSLVDLLENPCPNFDIATSDDAGNLYFSNWVYSPGATLVNDQAQACVGRIAAGEDVFDASWSLKMADVTEGREAAALGYLGGSEGLLSVFHDERVTYDPSTGDIFSYLFGANWHLWTVDLVSKAAHEITAIDWNGGGYYSYRIDGKTYVLSPGSDYKTTTVYEVSGDGSVTQILHTRGWSTRLFKLR